MKPQQGLFGGPSEPNFMPSRLFDQDDLSMSNVNNAKNDDWANLLGDFDPFKKQETNEQNQL